jgi:DHA1 family bicyclomycin/chloramphenicol resistance-like MFS transporter
MCPKSQQATHETLMKALLPMTSGLVRNAIILGLLSAIGPFAIDMYLPCTTDNRFRSPCGDERGADESACILSGIGAGTTFLGPLSDMIGRKLPLYGGLVLFSHR